MEIVQYLINTIKKMAIKSINYSRLLKLELPILANRVITTVEKHDAETLHIKETFDLLEKTKPQILALEVRFGPHPITEDLNDLRKKRIKNAGLIISHLNLVIKQDIEAQRKLIKVVQPVVTRFLSKLSRDSDDIATENVKQFMLQIQSNEDLSEALTELEFLSYANSLQIANLGLIENLAKRDASISQRMKSTPSISRPIHGALRNLFNQINLAKSLYPGVDYQPLIDELNVILTSYEAKINLRATLNKKKADKAGIENESDENNDTSTITIEEDETPLMMRKMDMLDTSDEKGTEPPVVDEYKNLNGNGKANSEFDR